MYTAVALAALSLAGAAVAQVDPSQHYESSLNMTVDINNIMPADTRAVMLAGWCNGQTDTCDTLCGTNTNLNHCDSGTLNWTCTCSANNSQPGLQYYTQTMPTFICQELYNECINSSGGIKKTQDECIKNIQDLCATQAPPKDPVVAGSGSGSDSSTTTMATKTSAAATHSATGKAATTSTSSAFAAPTMAAMGNGAGLVAAVGVLAYIL